MVHEEKAKNKKVEIFKIEQNKIVEKSKVYSFKI